MKKIFITPVLVLVISLLATLAYAQTVANLKEDVRSADPGRLAGWSFQWNPTAVEVGDVASYENLLPGKNVFFRNLQFSKGSDNYQNGVEGNNPTQIYSRASDGAWWLIPGASAEHSTDGLDHCLILGYTIQKGEAGDLRLRTTSGNGAPSSVRFYVNDKLVEQRDFPNKINREMVIDLGVLTEGDTVHVAFAADSSFGTGQRRWYGNITIAERAKMISLDTGHTIQKVRTATYKIKGQKKPGTLIIGSTYDGEIVGMTYTGDVRWMTPLSGLMVHDLWCADLNRDGTDEILAANADGKVYCLTIKGEVRWSFAPNQSEHIPPMYAVCAVRGKDRKTYVVCGGFDKNIYYLSAYGKVVKTIESKTYSIDKPWGAERKYGAGHISNFLRPVPQKSGYDLLAVEGIMNHMQSAGTIYEFEPLADQPQNIHKVGRIRGAGDFRVCNPEENGHVYFVGSSALGDQSVVRIDSKNGERTLFEPRGIGSNGYRVSQVDTIPDGDSYKVFILCGSHIILLDPDMNPKTQKKFGSNYAYNDVWQDRTNNTVLLASAQSGGSCIHVIDLNDPQWGQAFMDLEPPGKIATILENAANTWTNLATFTAPDWERKPVPVYLSAAPRSHPVAANIIENYDSPVFLKSVYGPVQSTNWRYQAETYLNNDYYRKAMDHRMKHTLTQEQVLERFKPEFEGVPGISYWAGHGNSPYYFQPETHMKIMDLAQGKKTVMIWPEMNGAQERFQFVMDDLIYPVARYAQTHNGNIHIRNKGVFWSGAVYLPAWSRLVSGEFADVFITSMEETTDKTQDLSIAGRLGIWASGALNEWGMRTSRDNPSFDRAREHSYQKLSNHFLRTMVYSYALGATHSQNTYTHADHMSLAWELIAKGALYIPKREEIVSFNPVHLSMTQPNEQYLEEAENHKFSIFYAREKEEQNPMVFSRMNASWMAAPVTEWDFSRYASGVKDRRQNFIPPFPNGMVLITPPQEGVFADLDAPRGKLTDHLHPLYRHCMKEFITDGRDYLSADGKKRTPADKGYKKVEALIQAGAKQLPLNVSGDVAWVCAQTAPNHLRLTLVDSGYINPELRTATVSFHTVKPLVIRDVLSGEKFDCKNKTHINIEVPLGLFRFIDIEFEGDILSVNETN